MWKKIIILIIITIFFCGVAYLLPIRYEDNDDATMAWIASGTYSGEPDCHLEYVNALYGTVLNCLYTLNDSVEWYSVLFSIFQILSFSVICYYLLKLFEGKKIYSTISIFFILSLWLWLIARFQFTTTAAVLAFAASLLLLDKHFISGGMLLVVASLIRFSAAGLVGLVMAPAFIYTYGREIKKCWVPLLIVLFTVAFCSYGDTLFYQSDEWTKYRELDSCRGRINDSPNDWRARGHLPQGMADVNYEMILAYFMDPGAVSNAQLESILDYLYHDVPLRKKLMNSFRGCFKKYWAWFLFVLIVTLPITFQLKDKKESGMVIVAFIVWVTSLSLLAFNCSVKNRVFTTSFIAMTYYLFFSLAKTSELLPKKYVSIILSIILFWGVFQYAVPAIKRSSSLADKQAKFQEQLDMVNGISGYSVVTNGGDFSVEMLNPFAMSKAIRPNVFINPYCYMGSPLNNDRLSSHLDLTKDDICMLSRKDADFSLLKKAVWTNYGVTIDTVHFADSKNFSLIKFIVSDEQAVE